jgi:two-component system CheB/CheR fusion protein
MIFGIWRGPFVFLSPGSLSDRQGKVSQENGEGINDTTNLRPFSAFATRRKFIVPAEKKKTASRRTKSTVDMKSGKKKKKAAAAPGGAKDFYIVGMGASAGGLEAFERFFQNMPNDSGMAFVLVPHLDPTHVSLMPELIQKSSRMEVLPVKDGTKVKVNSVSIVPPNHSLAILNGTLQLLDPPKTPGPRMPIDYFFRSLGEDQGEKAICIILSGMGSDGTLGLRTIKGEGGMAMVQAPDSAKYDSMPRSAIKTDLVDYVLFPEKMPEQLIAYAKHATKKLASKLTGGKVPDALQKIFILLRTHTGHDFSSYKQNTICRRVERRMDVHQINKISNYVRYLQENSVEVETLFKELLIGVTNFFRDKEAFEALKEKALAQIIKGKPNDYTIRVWVPACSTGEEAYSIAILLRECIEQLKKPMGVQVFATDIDTSAIETARAGTYPASISGDVSPDRLKRYFKSEDNVCTVKKDIRETLIFAPQDIIKDPPFTKLDLICCRNLLIYLESELQKRLLPLFHYSLKPDGILFLGSSETIGGFTDLFGAVDKKWKIYRRKEAVPGGHIGARFPVTPQTDKVYEPDEKRPPELTVAQLAQKSLLAQYAPPSVMINERGEILYIHGRTGKYLEPAPGEARLSIYQMAREGLKFEIPSAIRKATTQKKEVTYKGMEVKGNGVTRMVNLTVRPMLEANAPPGAMMVVFEDVTPAIKERPPKKKGTPKKKADEKAEALGKELHYTKESLQTTIEELETSNEELKTTNEELQSTNEELQSTNEELETSKEEQQSMNEELTTVNTELQSKIDELSRANDDLKNLLEAIEVPTIFLDNDLFIKRFTSDSKRLINLIQTDIGRPIGDIASKIEDITISEMAKAVLKDLVYREREVRTRDGFHFLMRIAPYRTTENVIDGVVITFMDITKEKELEEREHRLAAERRLAAVIQDSNDAVTLQDFEGHILDWNKGAERMYGYSKAEALNMNIRDISPKGKEKETLELIKRIKEGEDITSFKTKRKTKDGKILDVWLTVTKLVDTEGKPLQMATTERDLAWLSGQ